MRLRRYGFGFFGLVAILQAVGVIGMCHEALSLDVGDASFPGTDALKFVDQLNTLASEKEARNGAQLSQCTNDPIRVCTYGFGTAAVLTGTKRASSELGQILWICGDGCNGDDIFSGVVLSLRLLAPDRPAGEYTTWLRSAGEAQRSKTAVRTTLGPVLIAVTHGDALGTWVSLRPLP